MNILNNEKLAFFVLIAGATFLKFATVMVLSIEPESDYACYLNMAITMLSTGHMDDGFGNVAYYSSGYPLFLIPFFGFPQIVLWTVCSIVDFADFGSS